jgi:hypothetical protein
MEVPKRAALTLDLKPLCDRQVDLVPITYPAADAYFLARLLTLLQIMSAWRVCRQTLSHHLSSPPEETI